ncbi:MAG TPA: hypothetical protein VK807_23340 [Gemmatimonadaceae bacterium]|jgi:hypothetical protein|nr:hypothetical protein [Gemmatimonadaceae bacterium]
MADEVVSTGGPVHGTHSGTILIIVAVVIVVLFLVLKGGAGGGGGGAGLQEIGPTQSSAQISEAQIGAESGAINTIASLIGSENQTGAQLQLGTLQANDQLQLGTYLGGLQNSEQSAQLAAEEYIYELETNAQQNETNANAHAFEEAAKAGYNSQYNGEVLNTISSGLQSFGALAGGLF